RLTITGDDQANGIQSLLVTGTAVTVTPDGSTSVNGQPAGMAVTLPGAATSLTANLLGGNDSLSINGSSDFALTGAATFNLGGGNNTLNLTTTGHVTLGSLAVTSGSGSSSVTVSPGAGPGTVNGRALFSFGPGGTNTVALSNTSFPGPAGVRVTAGISGSNVVTANNVTVARTFSLNTGRAASTQLQTFTNDTLGGLAMTGANPSLSLTSSTINGNLSEIGNLSSNCSTANVVAVTGNVILRSGGSAGLITGPPLMNGTFTARNVTVSGPGVVTFFTGGTSATINGNLSVTGQGLPSIQVQTSGLTEVKGNVVEGGGSRQTTFLTLGPFKADRNVTVRTAPNNTIAAVIIGTSTAPAAIQGNLTVATGNGQLGMALTNVTVGGATRIMTGAGPDTLQFNATTFQGAFTANTGAGADTLQIDATTFQGAFTANTGAGNDTFNIAQAAGMPAPVTFTGRVVINAGPGNDTLRLGRSTGDANSRAVFSVPTSSLNGGPGFNTYFKSTSQVTGPANFLNWTNA
ncbi:MAG: hypothetical protein J2P46_02520, partial [Zavarzinella sp.]|nr:hypothetical protein [Zavarzinella sp.]